MHSVCTNMLLTNRISKYLRYYLVNQRVLKVTLLLKTILPLLLCQSKPLQLNIITVSLIFPMVIPFLWITFRILRHQWATTIHQDTTPHQQMTHLLACSAPNGILISWQYFTHNYHAHIHFWNCAKLVNLCQCMYQTSKGYTCTVCIVSHIHAHLSLWSMASVGYKYMYTVLVIV